MDFYKIWMYFVILSSGYRISLMFAYDNGPFNIFVKLRKWSTERAIKACNQCGGKTWFNCITCNSVLISGLMFFISRYTEFKLFELYTSPLWGSCCIIIFNRFIMRNPTQKGHPL